MPPFTTLNGQTGYFDNSGQFVPASQEEYNQQFGMLQQFGNNPFISAQQTFTQQPQSIQQGAIQPPMAGQMTNEQKVMQAQGDDSPMLGNMPYVQKGNELGVQKGKSFFPYNASTASGHPLNTATNTVFNAYDLTTNRKNDIVNPYVAQVNLMRSQNAASFLNKLSNKPTASAATTQTQVTVPQTTGATEIIPTSTAEQAEGGNWFSNMFNKPSVKGVPAADKITNVIEKGPSLFKQSKDFFGSEAGQATSAGIGAGLGVATSLIGANASKYDQRVGMSKPNAFSTIAGDSTVTQIGLNPALMGATGGLSAVAGLGIDLVKNIVKYNKQKDSYENKKLAVDTMQQLDDARENMKPDYTGYARSGTQVNPYLKAQYGTKAIVEGKKMDIDSDEYRRLYNSGNLMRVDEGGMPTMTTEDLVITGQMTDNTREQREIQKERDAQGLNYNWSSGSNNPYMSQPKNTVPTGINSTVPSVPPFQPIFNPEDDYLKDYVGKSLGEQPFIFSNASEVGMGYNHFGNNAWMSTGLGTVDDSPTIMGHLASRYSTNEAYEASKKANDIPSLYFFYKDLSKEKNWQEDVGVSATKYYDNLNELNDGSSYLEREGRFIDDIVKKQGYGHNIVMDENGNKLIRNFTPDKDKFMGSVTLTPEMYKAILEAPNQTEAKRRLMQMAKIPQDVDMDKLFIHMNLSKPKNLSTYFKAKTVNPNSVRNWHDTPTGTIYINRVKQDGIGHYNVTKHRIGGMVQNPYLKAQYGTDSKKKPIYTGQDKSPNYKSNVTINGKQIGKGSQEYKDAYDSGNLMSVDYDGMPVMYSNQQAEVTAEAPAWLKQQREREKDPVAFAVRKGTGDFAKGTAQGVGTALTYAGEVMNTPLAMAGELLSGRNDYYSALPNLTRSMKDMGLENQLTSEDKKWLPKNDQMTPGALVSDNPLIQMGIDVPLDILTGKGFKALTKTKDFKNLAKATGKYLTIPRFKSEIDWSKWNKEIPDNKPLMKEYNAIEKQTKANKTWMKNPDGTPYQGTPEQFVQENSENFKKAFPEGYDKTYRGSQFLTPRLDRTAFQNKDVITFGTSNESVAKNYATYHPVGFQDEFQDVGKDVPYWHPDRDVEKLYEGRPSNAKPGIYEILYPTGKKTINAEGQGNRWFNIKQDEVFKGIVDKNYKDFRGGDYRQYFDPSSYMYYPDMTYGNVATDDVAEYMIKNDIPVGKVSNVYDGADYFGNPTPSEVTMLNTSKIPVKSRWYNNGMFDMTNPNIFKGLAALVATETGLSTLDGGTSGPRQSNDLQSGQGPEQKRQGGKTNPYLK
jgi:hypothetical protein